MLFSPRLAPLLFSLLMSLYMVIIDDSGHHLGQYWLRGGIYRALVACFYHCLAHSVRAYVVWRTALAAAGGAVGQQAVTGCSAARLMGYTV